MNELNKIAYDSYRRNVIFRTTLFIVLLSILIISFIFALHTGAVKTSFVDIWNTLIYRKNGGSNLQQLVLLDLRLPRVVGALVVGAALAVSGAICQSLFRNPLADSGLLGMNSGAALMVALLIILGPVYLPTEVMKYSHYLYPVVAFLGSLLTTYLIYRLSRQYDSINIATLILTGVAINAAAISLTGLLVYSSNDLEMRNIILWTMGGFSNANWLVVLSGITLMVVPFLLILRISKFLNAAQLGNDQSYCLGIAVNRYRILCVIMIALLTGAATAIAGPISFVGLIIPHILRLFIGTDHRILLPCCALLGGIVVILADVLARMVMQPAELPVGLILGFCGAPYFMFLLYKQRRGVDASY